MTVPVELKNGTYADLVSVWHNEFGFTLDFAVLGQPRAVPDDDNEGDGATVQLDADVVARMKIPATVIFQITRAIADNVTKFEENFGPITPRPSEETILPGTLENTLQGEGDENGDENNNEG